jgi:hypothetical protein
MKPDIKLHSLQSSMILSQEFAVLVLTVAHRPIWLLFTALVS